MWVSVESCLLTDESGEKRIWLAAAIREIKKQVVVTINTFQQNYAALLILPFQL